MHAGHADWHRKSAALHQSATIIARSWRSYFRKKVFRVLKDNLYKAERAMTVEILKRLAPTEAQFISDTVAQPRVRFRFGGVTFPPIMFYKIYSRGRNVHYFSGRRIIEPGSKAAVDACRVMGVRLYTELVVSETNQPDPIDVTNRLEYVQYMNSVDNLPARFGGRNNDWRVLNFDDFQSREIYFEKSLSKINLHQRKRRKRPPKPIQKPSQGQDKPHDVLDIQDDFGTLFEWANTLNINDLHDFIEI